MWVLLSGGLRRWIIFSLAVPAAAGLLGALGRGLETRNGSTQLSRGLQGASRLVSNRARDGDSPGSAKARRSLRRWNR